CCSFLFKSVHKSKKLNRKGSVQLIYSDCYSYFSSKITISTRRFFAILSGSIGWVSPYPAIRKRFEFKSASSETCRKTLPDLAPHTHQCQGYSYREQGR